MARPLTSQEQLAAARKVLKHYAETCDIRAACKKAGVGKSSHYRWLERYPSDKYPNGYAAKFHRIQLEAGDCLESMAVERATKGWKEPIFYQGEICGYVRRPSDALLMQLLRGFKPEKYGVSRTEISGPDKAPVQARIEVVFVRPGDHPGSPPQ